MSKEDDKRYPLKRFLFKINGLPYVHSYSYTAHSKGISFRFLSLETQYHIISNFLNHHSFFVCYLTYEGTISLITSTKALALTYDGVSHHLTFLGSFMIEWSFLFL